MRLRLVRTDLNPRRTIGELFVGDQTERVAWTLEDAVREILGEPVETWKIQNRTAIPAGTYRVIVDFSNRFQRPLPLLLNVPGFTGIRIHPGNTDADTDGCILVGLDRNEDEILRSAVAAFAIQQTIANAINLGQEVTISVG